MYSSNRVSDDEFHRLPLAPLTPLDPPDPPSPMGLSHLRPSRLAHLIALPDRQT